MLVWHRRYRASDYAQLQQDRRLECSPVKANITIARVDYSMRDYLGLPAAMKQAESSERQPG